jgi:hypothetical protein
MPVDIAASRSAFEAYLIEVATFVIPLVSLKVTVIINGSPRLIFQEKLIASHDRCWEKEQFFYQPVHYLASLERKPGGLDFARPLADWQLPKCFDLLRRRLEANNDRQGTRQYIQVLRLLERYSLKQLKDAIEYALDIDVIDRDSIRVKGESFRLKDAKRRTAKKSA